MKTTRTCPKCGGSRVARLETLPDLWGKPEKCVVLPFSPRFLGIVPHGRRWCPFPVNQLHGELEAFVCADCGFLETYVKRPETVDFDKIEGLTWTKTDDE